MSTKATKQLNIRLEPSELEIVRKLQKKRGESFNLSGWLRETILREAKKDLQHA